MPRGVPTDRPGPDGTLRGRQRSGRPWERFKKAVFDRWGMTCYVCGHGPPRIRGRFRMEVGHLDAVKLNPLQLPSTDRARPMHGSNAPCPTCLGRTGRPRCCNQEMGTKSMDEVHKPRSRW